MVRYSGTFTSIKEVCLDRFERVEAAGDEVIQDKTRHKLGLISTISEAQAVAHQLYRDLPADQQLHEGVYRSILDIRDHRVLADGRIIKQFRDVDGTVTAEAVVPAYVEKELIDYMNVLLTNLSPPN